MMIKIKSLKFLLHISLLALFGQQVFSATYYISPSGNDTSGSGSSASPWRTTTKAFAQGGGHTYIFKDGTYNYSGGEISGPPSGSAGAYTVIKAENDGAAILRGFSQAMTINQKSYIQIEGLTIKDGTSSHAIYITDSHHIKLMRVGVKNGIAWSAQYGNVIELSSLDGVTGTKDCLLEDVWVVGAMRYGILIGGTAGYSERNILRRCIVRFDGGGSPEPHAGISNYGATSGIQGARNNILQNCITIDFNAPNNTSGEGVYAGFYTPHAATNIDFYGCIALNTRERGWMLNEDAGSNNNDMYNCLIWDALNEGIAGQRSSSPGSVLDQITIGSSGGDAFNSYNGMRAAITNSLFVDNGGGITGANSVSYSHFWGDSSAGTNALTSNPAQRYITRVEANSPAYQSGSGGATRGATIEKKYGVSGTLHGESGYDTLTNENLWPWPNQQRIHDLFAEADGISGMPSNNEARGFAAPGQTLTNYVWNYLGNGNPYPDTPDTTSPSVSISNPANNATVSGTISVTATASDNIGVSRVEFIVNGSVRSTAFSAPYTYDWDTTADANGSFGLQAKAYDAAGNTNTSAISVTVNNVVDTTPPTVSLTAPANGATVSGSVSVTATASDDNAVSRVQFLLDGVVVSTDTTSPYSYTWNTTGGSNGSHALTARAFDANGNNASSAVSVTVANADTTLPTVSVTAPANGATVSGTVSLTASASDNIGVSRVEFSVDGTVRSTDTTSPYSYSWNTTSEPNGSHTLSARSFDAAGNSANASVSVTVSNADVTNPSVSIASPADGATISGTISVAATASDNVAVSRVEFYVDGTLDATDTTSPYSYSWNTNNDLNGSHTVMARAYDAAGNSASASISATVNNPDVAPPTVSVTAPSNGSTVSGSVNVTAGASDNVGVARVEISVDGVVKSTDVSSPYSYSWDTLSETNGAHTVLIRAYDAAGNSASASVGITVSNTVPDTTNPAVSVTAPIDGTTVSGTVNVTASASDNVGVNRVQFLIDGVVRSTDSTSPYAYSWNSAVETNAAHTVTARAYDAAGNSASNTVNVTVSNTVSDTTNPTISITAPASNATVSGSVNITVSASDNVGVARVEFSVDGVVRGTDTVSPFSYSWNTTGETNGAHALTVRAYDAAGNNASASRNVTVSNTVPDTTNPSASITAPANGATVSGTLSVTASASDNVGVNRVQFLIDGAVVSTDTTNPYSYNWNTNGYSNGSHALTARAFDAAGNSALSAAVSVTVSNAGPDTTAPSISISAPANGATVTGSVSVSATASDNVGVTRVDFLLDGTLQTQDASSPYGFTWNTALSASGSHTLTARAYDAAGNNTSASVTVTIPSGPADATNPSVSITAPSNGASLFGTASVAATASDNVGVARVEFFVDGTLQNTDTSSPYGFSLDASALSNGAHTILARAYDAAGNSASSSVSVTVSNANVISPAAGGTVSEGSNGCSVSFGPNALTQPAQVTITPEPTAGKAERDTSLLSQNLVSMGNGREIIFVSAGSMSAATLTLPYDASAVPAGYSASQVRVAYYNPATGKWEIQPAGAVTGNTVQTTVTHFSMYKPVLEVADAAALQSGETYVYPNPAAAPDEPVIRASLGDVTEIALKIYDMGGREVHAAQLPTSPSGYSGGQAYYDYTWADSKSSGMYMVLVEGRKVSGGVVRSRANFAVVR